jgi:hypothetical protein
MLYHPPNPVRFLEVPFDNLRPGAYPFGDASLRSCGGLEHLLLYAHAEQ